MLKNFETTVTHYHECHMNTNEQRALHEKQYQTHG